VDRFLKFTSIIKVDEAAHTVWGIVTSETPDADQEICDYPTAKEEIKKWSDDQLAKTIAAGQDPSLGNMRVMHQLQIGGKAVKIQCNDEAKQIWVGSEPANDEVWHLLKGGFLTGHSIGGKYLWKRKEGEYTRYGPGFSEISYVDKGSNPDATFAYVKADGTTELRKFVKPGPEEKKILEKLAKGVKYLVPEGQHLPYTDESGKPSHSHMGAAWAALHGGYRGNKYEGPGKERAIAHLKEIYRQEGMEPPSEKALTLLDLEKELETCPDSELSTLLEKFHALVGDLVRKQTAKGEPMNKEQIVKCAAALGISAEEFTKQFIEGDALEKGKKGLAALHAHLKKAHSHHTMMHGHHDKIVEMHKTHAAHHATMADHLENCMKAHGACMDGEEADKAVTALLAKLGAPEELILVGKTADGVEIFRKKGTAEVKLEGLKAAEGDLAKTIADAIKAATEPLQKKIEDMEKELAPQNGFTGGARIAVIDRKGNIVEKVAATEARNPMAVD
jgi:hypothetical protein